MQATTDETMESTTGSGATQAGTGMTKCALAFRRGLLLGLFITAALAAMGLWAANVVQAHAHHSIVQAHGHHGTRTEQARTT